MTQFEIFETHILRPFERFGITHPFFSINLTTLHGTWVVLTVLLILIIIAHYFLRHRTNPGYALLTIIVQAFADLCAQNLRVFSLPHFVFITSLFIFIFLCNCISLLPFVEEPTKDLNTTLALGIISFAYIQYYAIKSQGFKHYLKEFFTPFFLLFPINILGEIAIIISISFRLFGNIFGGFVISTIYKSALGGSPLWETIGIITGVNFIVTLFFGLFEGVIQAFVFSMLSLTYLSLAVTGEEAHD